MNFPLPAPSSDAIDLFKKLVDENRYDFCKLVYIIFPFGQKDHELEFIEPYDWQMEEWKKLSDHLSNPETRYETYRLIISSGNGAAKTSFGAMTYLMLMYTQQVRGRITANTKPQMTSVVWPEYDKWFRHARYSDHWFEKLGESIKARDVTRSDTWRLDAVTWDAGNPAAVSGLHNLGKCVLYILEEAPGIPAVIWKYISGAMTDVNTIKVWMAFGNSDDPESQFEQNMGSPDWHARRIDTRTLKHVDPKQVAAWLREYGSEDHDDFRVRVRGLPRKSAKDSIISMETVMAALERGKDFDTAQVKIFPAILMCDPAWTGGDETTIWYIQGPYAELLDKYKLDKATQDHKFTYDKMVKWEKELGIDAVHTDQGEGTAIKTLANHDERVHWELISFAGSPNDEPEVKDSQYANIRAQMYYQADEWLRGGGALNARKPEWRDDIQKQLCWTKGARHKTTLKKLAESKKDIKTRVGQSPDVADGFVLGFARAVTERREENTPNGGVEVDERGRPITGSKAWTMPKAEVDYDEDYGDLYR